MSPGEHKSWFLELARKLRPLLPYGVLSNLHQWVTGYTHEPDFEVFCSIPESRGLVLDVGASRGQSALSVLRRARKVRVLSVEPNPKHRWSLLLIWFLYPFRYRFKLVAAGDVAAEKTLHVPGKRASGLSAQGSLDPAEFDKDYVRERLAKSGFDTALKSGFRKVQVHVVALDDFSCAPDLIKLDVEGFEEQALKGLEQTLKRERPALLIEINNLQRWRSFLGNLGYSFYFYNGDNDTLEPAGEHVGELNLFCLHDGSDSEITRILLAKVKR